MNPTNSHAHSWRQHVVVRHSPRARRIRLRIQPSGRVELVLPRGVGSAAVPEILDRHESWVLKNLEKLGTSVPLLVAAPETVKLQAIGEHWQIEYLADEPGRYGCRPMGDGMLRVSGGTAWQPALRRWVSRKGKLHLLPWLEQVSEEVGLPYQGATVRGQRTRWGSCSSHHRINLNYGLLFLPPELVRYLFIHELCHTRYLNHSARYWQLVAAIEPGYRELDHALRRGSRYLPSWLHAVEIKPVS